MMDEKRQWHRTPVSGTMTLRWKDSNGVRVTALVECLGLSRGGATVELDHEIPAGTLVQIESPQFGLAGTAFVKHSRPFGMRYRGGLAFTGGLEWIEGTA